MDEAATVEFLFSAFAGFHLSHPSFKEVIKKMGATYMVLDLCRVVISYHTTGLFLYLDRRRNTCPLVGCPGWLPSPSLLYIISFRQPGK